MKIQRNIISIQITEDEWNQVKKEFRDLKFKGEQLDYKKHPMLFDFIESIDLVHNNPSHKVDRDLGTL